ncbi:hypothetical protein Sj15T_12700 [Sphingobium sp. TA15]|nr:hypothetical protein Sj15T_12700 [Sphingobium sp. TA15]
MPSLGHTPRGRLPDEQASEAADAPASLKIGRIDVEDIGLLEGAGIEHDEVWFSEIAIDAVEDTEDIIAT